MKRLAALVVTSLLALSACSGGGTAGTGTPGSAPPSLTQPTLTAYRVPLTHVASVDAAAELGAKQRPGTRGTSGLAGLPTIFSILDAPRFGAGAQINLAIVGVDAIGADGIVYPIVSYATPVIVNMLSYQTSALVLGQSVLPAQNYPTLRLKVLGSLSTIVAWNTTYPIKFGYYDRSHTFTAAVNDVMPIDFPVKTDGTSGTPTVLADFNTVESVKIRDGVAMVGSRIAATPYNSSSVIAGRIVNKAGAAVGSAIIAAIDGAGNVAATTMANDDGTFELHAISGGNYQIMVYNDYTAASGDQFVSNFADSALNLTGPLVNVPSGYKISLGNIVD